MPIMKKPGKLKRLRTVLLVCLLLSMGSTALAHLPRLVGDEEVVRVKDPEVSQAFYAQLSGRPALYEINSSEEFLLYVSLLVPDLPGIETDISARVLKVDGSSEELLFFLDGEEHRWEEFYEPFAGDRYLEGPEYEKRVSPGLYRIEVSNPHQRGKYVLSVGKREVFTPAETLHTLKVLPSLKRDFFEKSPLTAYFNLVGLFMLVVGVVLAVPIYFLLRQGLRK